MAKKQKTEKAVTLADVEKRKKSKKILKALGVAGLKAAAGVGVGAVGKKITQDKDVQTAGNILGGAAAAQHMVGYAAEQKKRKKKEKEIAKRFSGRKKK